MVTAFAQGIADLILSQHSPSITEGCAITGKVQKVIRDRSWVEREYGRDKWPVLRDQILSSIAGGERSLSRAVANTVRFELGKPLRQPTNLIAYGESVAIPASVAWYGLYTAVAEEIIALCGNETDAVIELGCGWGRSLFEVWLRGGPRKVPYYAFEFTKAGLECVEALSSLEPDLNIRAAHFDFSNPDFSVLPRPLRHAVVFTVSSVNQVPILQLESYGSILAIADKIDCIHFEEIGWQMAPDSPTQADRRAYAGQHDYNANLWTILSDLARRRDIEIADSVVDLYGLQRLFPISFVHWRRDSR
jgi:hypothetical protein